MKVALVQLDLAWEDPAENHRRAERRLNEAAAAGARLAVLPEMFSCGFTMDTAKCAEAEGGPTETFLRDVAGGLGIHVIAGVPLAPGPRNFAVWVSPAGEVRRYAKIHPFSFGDETKHYVAGDRVERWEIEGLRVTPFVCYDLRFPEPFRLAAADTDAFVVIANWPARRAQHWRTLLRARAIENQAFVLGVNRVGEGGGLTYEGHSAVIDPLGETLVEGAVQEQILACDVDPAAVASWRRTFPALLDRKPAYR